MRQSIKVKREVWALLTAMTVTGKLVAASYTWLPQPISSNWLTDANWDQGVWTDGNEAIFGTSTQKTVTLSGAATASGVTVTEADYTLAGDGTLTLNGPFNVSAGVTATVTAPLASTSTATDDATRFAKRGDGTLVVKGRTDQTNVFYRVAAHGGTLAFDGGVHEIACASTSPDFKAVPLFMEREGRLLVEGGAQLVFTETNSFISNPGGDLLVTNGFVDAWNVTEFLNGFGDQNTASPAATISRITLQDAGEMRVKQIRLGKVQRSASYYGPEYGTIHLRKGGTLCVRNFTMDSGGSSYCGALDFEGGRLVITNDVEAGKDLSPFGGNYTGNWTNVLLRVHEGGAHVALSGLSQYSRFRTPFISAAEHDGGFHFYGDGFCYLTVANTFNGGLHLDGSGYLIPELDLAMGKVPDTPTPNVFFNSSSAILHFPGGWTANKNRDFIINTNITAHIGVLHLSARIAGVITGHGTDGHLGTLRAVSNWSGCLEIGPEDERTNTIGKLRVDGHLRHVAGTTLVTSNAPGKIGADAPFYVTGNGSSYQPNKGVFEVAGGTVKVTPTCWMDIRNYGQVIVTNGLLDAANTAEYLNALSGPARTLVGGNGTMTCRQLRISQTDMRYASGEPRAEVSLTTGGVLKLGKFWIDPGAATSCGILNLDGGVLVAQRNEVNFLGESGTPAQETVWQSNILVRAGSSGAIIDTEGYTVTVKAPLRSGAEVDGGLVKRGTGTLTMASTNSYNGATRVEGGQLIFTHADGLPAGALEFSADVAASTDKTTPNLTATSWTGDTVRLTDAANLPDTFSGEKTLATFTVPLASTPALELRDADGNTVKTGAWNLRRSSDGTSLLLSYHRGTVFTLR